MQTCCRLKVACFCHGVEERRGMSRFFPAVALIAVTKRICRFMTFLHHRGHCGDKARVY